MAVILDTALIIRRRTELGITARALARFLNVTLAVVRLLELGSNHDEISRALVVRLAAGLGVDVETLLCSPHPQPSASEDDNDDAVA